MKQEYEMVLDLIKEVGVSRLANWDGCICSNFKVRNVEVDMSCGKGRDRGIWISSPSDDYSDHDFPNGNSENLLRPIAEEVKRQIETDGDHRGPIEIYFHEWGTRTPTVTGKTRGEGSR